MSIQICNRACLLVGIVLTSNTMWADDGLQEILKDLSTAHDVVYSTDNVETLNKYVGIYVDLLSKLYADKPAFSNELTSILEGGDISAYRMLFRIPPVAQPRISESVLLKVDHVFERADADTKCQLLDYLGNLLTAEELTPRVRTLMADENPQVRLAAIQTACRNGLESLIPEVETAIARGGTFQERITPDFATEVLVVEKALIACGNARLSSPRLRADAEAMLRLSNDSVVSIAALYYLCETSTKPLSDSYMRELVVIASDSNHRFQVSGVTLSLHSKTIAFITQSRIFREATKSKRRQVCIAAVESISQMVERHKDSSEDILKESIRIVELDCLEPLFRQLASMELSPPILEELKSRLAGVTGVSAPFLAEIAITRLLRNTDNVKNRELIALLLDVKQNAASAYVAEISKAALLSIGADVRTKFERMRELELRLSTNVD